jgi:protein tyrosine phosphatase (PTP) superfamily phosphohydrolase (DUF442 family)
MQTHAPDDANLSEIHNFEQMTDWLATSGQPRRQQFETIASAGYDVVVNLALATSDDALVDEGNIVEGLDMAYAHIPVEMDNPTLDDLKTFFAVLNQHEGEKIWVHCVVNARVSAFVYHYLRYEKGVSEDAARSRILEKWQPIMDEPWTDFMNIPKEALKQG